MHYVVLALHWQQAKLQFTGICMMHCLDLYNVTALLASTITSHDLVRRIVCRFHSRTCVWQHTKQLCQHHERTVYFNDSCSC